MLCFLPTRKSGNPGEQVSLKLSVPEAKVLSLEGDDGEEDEVMGGEEGEEEDGSTMSSSRTNRYVCTYVCVCLGNSFTLYDLFGDPLPCLLTPRPCLMTLYPVC